MTNDNDLIKRGDALAAIQEYAVRQVGAFQHPTLKGAAEAIATIPAVAASQAADADLLFDAYKGLLVLHRMLDKHGLIVGAETTNKLVDRIVAAHPEFPPRTALRSAVAASQPANPVTNADSRQRVTVKPLVWVRSHVPAWNDDWHTVPGGYSIRCADENGWCWKAIGLGAYGWRHSAEAAKAAAQADYEARILAAIDVQPDPDCCLGLSQTDCANVPSRHCEGMRPYPRDAQIARLVGAGETVIDEYWNRIHGVSQIAMRNLRAAIAAVKRGDA